MSKIRYLVRHSFFQKLSVYTISSYINRAIPFLILPVLTNYLSTNEYGEISMFLALMNLIMAIFGLSIDGAFMRKYYDSNKYTFSKVSFNYLLLSTTSFSLCLVLLALFKIPVAKYSGVPINYIIPSVICAFFTTICYCVNSLYQARGSASKYAIFTNGWTLLNASLSIIFVVAVGWGALGRVLGITISAVLFGTIGLFIVNRTGIKIQFDSDIIKEELSVFGIPSLPMNLRGTILQFTDKLFITNLISLSAAGIYTVGTQLSMVVEVFVRSIALAYVPWLYSKMSENKEDSNRKIVKLTYFLVVLIFTVSVLWIIFAKYGIVFFISSEYHEAIAYLFWLVLSQSFLGIQLLLVSFIYYSKRTKVYAIISTISIVLNIILNYVLIKEYGPLGAAVATAIVYCFMLLATAIIVFNMYKQFPWLLKKNKDDR